MAKIGMLLRRENVVELVWELIVGTKYEESLNQFKKKGNWIKQGVRELDVHGTKVSWLVINIP
jgi:hypothetical protein